MNGLASLRRRYSETAVPLRTERRMELIVLVLAMLILLQLLWLGITAQREPRVEPVAPAADSLRATATSPALVPSDEQRLAVRARPLFWASRRPLVQEVEEKAAKPVVKGSDKVVLPKPAKPLEALLVSGVYGAGADSGAIMTYKGKLRRVATGQELDGWELEAVGPNRVVFVSAGVRDERPLVQRAVAVDNGASSSAAAAREQQATEQLRAPAAAGGKKDEAPRLTLGG